QHLRGLLDRVVEVEAQDEHGAPAAAATQSPRSSRASIVPPRSSVPRRPAACSSRRRDPRIKAGPIR
ncbi:hypothetical protein, partial [Dactylosporangium sp. NPDC049140]|uniref:hypothetical protein n=1 Tax=Dactylosporangium sp. NPDC049140 TaxID=3155647 RepID=UPI0033D6DDCA